MAQDDPFTLDLFGSTALSSGLGLGVTAFAGGLTVEPGDDDDPDPATPAPAMPFAAVARATSPAHRERGANFHLADYRALAKGWKDRARDDIAAIRLAAAIEADERAATTAEQEQLIRFIGFGASELANSVFRRPGEAEFRKGWEAIGSDLEEAIGDLDHASLARCTQYAHFTPEFIVRAIWAGLQRLGWRGGRVLDPGIGTGLFPALMPAGLRDISHVTGIELDPVTARIVRLLQPRARIVAGDFARTALPASFDLAIGNPPFSDRTVRSDRAYRSLGLRLHDYFIARAIELLKPGALAAFVTSSGTMDKADGTARVHLARTADLVAAIRLPEGSFRASAGADVVVDILFFRKRKIGDPEGDRSWLDVDEVRPTTGDEGAIRVNRWFADHPAFVLGTHDLAPGPFGETYTCRPRDGEDLDAALSAVIALLPEAIYDGEPDMIDPDLEDATAPAPVDLPSDRHVREGSFFFDKAHGLMQVLDGQSVAVKARKKRGIWRIVSAGSTYLAHAVGAGKTMTMAAAIMEQHRLGLIAKAMLVVPGHCLAQAAREFLALYPSARILVADETNFTKDKRQRFLSRAATAPWDAIIITHSAFRFIAVPSAFEQQMIQDELELYETLLTKVETDDRVSRKRLERLKEGLKERLESLSTRKDDLLTISEIGVDQIIVDEAQEFRKLTFATNMSTLKGVDPNGSQRAWDLYVKSRFIETKALVLASGTPITNTLGEMFTVQRYLGYDALAQRGLHEFDAWASTFGDVSTVLELQPSGKYKPVTRFATFVNVPELIAMFRSFADVVMPEDLRQHVKVPAIATGRRQILTSRPTAAFRRYQVLLGERIKVIEMRDRPPEPGDDILLSVITDGRHAAIDLRLVDASDDNEPDNKLNNLIANAYRIWKETAENTYLRPDGKPFELPGAAQMIFSDLGTISVEKTRGFLGLSLDSRRAHQHGRAGIGNRLHAGLQEVRGQAAPVRRCACR
ncbi:adenine-specific DNA methylase [Bradyrhizobium sp. USDA 10063]